MLTVSILLPSGKDMVSGRVVSCFSDKGASVTRKCPVAPESSTAQFLTFLLLRPIVANKLFASWSLYLDLTFFVCFGEDVLENVLRGVEVLLQFLILLVEGGCSP